MQFLLTRAPRYLSPYHVLRFVNFQSYTGYVLEKSTPRSMPPEPECEGQARHPSSLKIPPLKEILQTTDVDAGYLH
jgi:hypothetical protein